MNELLLSVLALSMRLLLYIATGFAARKTRVMQDGFDRMLSRFVMAIPLPCMIINSFQLEYSLENLLEAPRLMALSIGSMAAVFALVWLATAKIGDRAKRKTIRFSLLFTNFTFVGFAVVWELYGADGLFSFVLFTLPIRVVFYGGASLILGKGGEKIDIRETLKRFFCEPVIAVFIGLFLYAFRIPLPSVLASTIESIGNMASPLGLMLCGATIADADWRSAFRRPDVFVVSLCRLLVMPALATGLFWLLRVEPETIRVIVCYFVASLTPTFLLRYDPEAVEARLSGGYMVVASTLLCVVTIPLWALVMAALFG